MSVPVIILDLTEPGPNGGPIHLLASEIAGVLTERALLRSSKEAITAVLMKGNEEPVRVAEPVEVVLDLWTRSIEGAWSA
jgi:hypothetical protein